jgi:hypothetical protein
MGPSPTPTKDPCADTEKDLEEPPEVEKARRYALGYTRTTAKNPWKGASVVWSNEPMWVPQPPLGTDSFVSEVLWVGTTSSFICWLEVGDSDFWDQQGVRHRQYYWAENSQGNGYHDYLLNGPAHPQPHQYQYYAIEWHDNTNQYLITIGQSIVAEAPRPGDTLYVHVGLETTDPRAQVLTPVQFSSFRIFDGKFWKYWPTRGTSAGPPAWWRWTGADSAANGIPFFILPAFPPIGLGQFSRNVRERIDAADAAKVFQPPPASKPEPERATGGPYIDAETIRLKALSEAEGRGAAHPRTESVRFMTYGEATEWYGTSRTTQVDSYREVYVVYVPGRITVGHHTRRTFDRSYYVYDASTGRLIQFGATDLPEPVSTGQPFPR